MIRIDSSDVARRSHNNSSFLLAWFRDVVEHWMIVPALLPCSFDVLTAGIRRHLSSLNGIIYFPLFIKPHSVV